MRYLALVLLLAVPAAAVAQPPERPSRPPANQQAQRPEQPKIGQPLLPAGWQWYVSGPRRAPRIGSPLLPAGQQWFGWRGDGRTNRPGHGGWYNPYFGYGAGYPAAPYEQEASNNAAPAAPPTTGVLRLDVTPSTGLQYYVDDVFIGTSADLGTEFELNAGARRFEIRAAGYKPLAFDVRIGEGQLVTYRGALEPIETTAASLPRPTGSSTFYIIPGCFMGNAPPQPETLPKGCDISRVRTR